MEEVDVVMSNWWSYLLKGIVAIIFGAILVSLPGATIKTLVVIVGLFALVDGLVNVIRAFVLMARKQPWGWTLAGGLVGFLLGAIILRHQEFALSFIVILAGIWIVLTGIVELAAAFDMPPKSGRGILAGFGILLLALGVIVLVYPFGSAYALMVVVGIYAFVVGVFDIGFSIYAKSEEHKIKKELEAA
ncbi:MAG TPA: DUF308 domain-containing protein [Candidatus Anoxymicrobiaceae bacterium]